MKNVILPFLASVFFLSNSERAECQTLSEFNWNSNPVTQAVVGPNAISVSSSATSTSGGVGGTNGLNPGTPKMDINLVLPGSTFDVAGIDMQIDFRRAESQGNFFSRGSGFAFGMTGGNLYVKFQIQNGMGGTSTINSGNIYSIPNDNSFRTYRFIYNNNTGIAAINVNGVSVWTYTANQPGLSMIWSNANMVIGELMDATGNNVVVFDNMKVQQVPPAAALFVNFIYTQATRKNGVNEIRWKAIHTEPGTQYIIQASQNGISFSNIDSVAAKGITGLPNEYQYNHSINLYNNLYYRIVALEINGKEFVSPVMKLSSTDKTFSLDVKSHLQGSTRTLFVQNPERGNIHITIYDTNGRLLRSFNGSAEAGLSQYVCTATGSSPVVVSITHDQLGTISKLVQ
ncbi:MAG: hypothetical protein GC171_07750 [Terrimonas sp.]|nr:hypothetical protein [Terrimonas sp.]